MESAVGYRLFVRELRGASVTPAGTRLVEHAARVLGAVSSLHHDLKALGDKLAGRSEERRVGKECRWRGARDAERRRERGDPAEGGAEVEADGRQSVGERAAAARAGGT